MFEDKIFLVFEDKIFLVFEDKIFLVFEDKIFLVFEGIILLVGRNNLPCVRRYKKNVMNVSCCLFLNEKRFKIKKAAERSAAFCH